MDSSGRNTSNKKSIALTILVIIVLVTILAVVASTGLINASGSTSTATVQPIVFKNDGKVYAYEFDGEITQTDLKKPEKSETNSSKFDTVTALATKVKVIGDNDYCVFQLPNDDGDSTINFVRPDESFYTFEMEQLILESAILSVDKSKILIRNEMGELYLVSLKLSEVEKYALVDENVTDAFFTGLKNDIVYMKDKDFYYSSGGYKSQIEKNVEQIAVSTDSMAVYYTKSDLTLVRFDVGKTTTLDSNVCNMVYCGGEKLAYIKDYSAATGNGNLFYAYGKKIIDVGVKAEEFLE